MSKQVTKLIITLLMSILLALLFIGCSLNTHQQTPKTHLIHLKILNRFPQKQMAASLP